METAVEPKDQSGFSRELGAWDVFVMNVAGYSIGVALTTNPMFIGAFAPHANIYGVLVLGVFVALFNGIVYGMFAAAMPNNGGEYVFVSQTFNRFLGFTANWGFTAAQLWGLALVSGWSISLAFSPALATLGKHDPAGIIARGGTLTGSTQGTLVGGMVVLVLVGLFSQFGARPARILLGAMFSFAVLSTGVLAFVLWTSSRQEFIQHFNRAMLANGQGDGAYARMLALAAQGGLSPGLPLSVNETFRALPFGFLIFVGFTYSVYVGSEVRRPSRDQIRGILGALVFGFVCFVAAMGGYFHIVGNDFNASLLLPDVTKQFSILGGASPAFVGALVTTDSRVATLILVGNIVWFFMLPFVIAQVCIKNVHAWSMHEILPARVRALSSRATPTVAIWSVIFFAMLCHVAAVQWNVTLVGVVAIMSVCFLLVSLAAIAFPVRRPDRYRAAPRLTQTEWFGLPAISVCGAIGVVSFGGILYYAIKYPDLSTDTSTRPAAIALVIGVYAVGIAWYFLRQQYLKSKSRHQDVGEINPFATISDVDPRKPKPKPKD